MAAWLRSFTAFTALTAATTSTAASLPPALPRPWSLLTTNSTQQFRGLSPISSTTAWISGTNGTVLRTLNSGQTWTNLSPSFPSENASSFEFRDIQAFSATQAVILSIGNGNTSRIYKTCDAGSSWTKTFVNQEQDAFYDCMAFEQEPGRQGHGIAMSDPVNGQFRLIETWDHGASWAIMHFTNDTMPPALAGEGGFAASGTCIEVAAKRWYFATGGVNPARIFRSKNEGKSWEVSNSSVVGGAAAGVYSVRFRDGKNGIAVGGDYTKPSANVDVASWSNDGGQTWNKANSFPAGYRSGASWVSERSMSAVAVGPTGSDVTFDGGRNWANFDNGTFDAVECVGESGWCWASGSKGRVGRINLNMYK